MVHTKDFERAKQVAEVFSTFKFKNDGCWYVEKVSIERSVFGESRFEIKESDTYIKILSGNKVHMYTFDDAKLIAIALQVTESDIKRVLQNEK